MKVIDPGPTFCAKGAVVFTKGELSAVIHALTVEHENVVASGGRFYGPNWSHKLSISVKEMEQLIADLQKHRDQIGA